ncbi:MAG: carboxylesterase family protein [Gammaproteobacteria bacterium]|jgi:para-nitrobenzyl esterase|nr:carboxylesterase [Gammaproteobacteria bacterium]MDP6098468.1 carboxylesterase family protein [Gammaproteobacteria bacterium]HJO12949.1 carboxylesterase family protein [Gammaproteobacteria bacterium]|tara:strand:- start:780 stop:2378 length:1599 start_codon:yes stop_codon:yes gene_type:complete
MKNLFSRPLNRRKFLQYSSSASLLLPLGTSLGQEQQVIAETQFGRVLGTRSRGVNVFKAVPYGADTSGQNRFMPPTDPAPWTGVRDALEYGAAAPQSDPASGNQQDGRESEDCLLLNIWTRSTDDGDRRPVMFWCHGGGFRTLSGSSPRYDGSNLSRRGDVVVVTINHRLNMLGFTHLGDLGGEEFAQSGTVGMLDIVHALKWVKNNIEQFGGDPNRVMIFGESGGGRKVATLLGMPAAKGLFHRAVIESGATLRLPERDQGTALAQRLLNNLGISRGNLSRIQEIPLNRMMAAYAAVTSQSDASTAGQSFSPVMDGIELPYHPFYPTASPVNPDVPVIVGANRTEMTYFADEASFALDETAMRNRVRDLVGENNADDVIEIYRQANPTAPPSEIYFLIFSDSRYIMASITIAERRAALRAAPVYLYYLTWETSATGRGMLSPHTLDIPLIFNNVRSHPLTADSETAIALSDKVSDTIIMFARTGIPDAGKLPLWTPYNSDTRATMVLNDESAVLNDPISRQREIMQPILKL